MIHTLKATRLEAWVRSKLQVEHPTQRDQASLVDMAALVLPRSIMQKLMLLVTFPWSPH